METKTITLFIFIFFTRSLFSQTLTPSEQLPSEMSLLLKSYNEIKLNQNEKSSFIEKLDKLSKEFSTMTKAEIYMLAKSEIYKSILQFPPLQIKKIKSISQQKLEEKSYNSKFFQWIYDSIQTDYFALKSSPEYEKLSRASVIPKSISNNDSALIKKLERIEPWITFFNTHSIEESHDSLKNFTLKTLDKLVKYAHLQNKFSESPTLKEYKAFYSLEEDKTEKIKEESIEDILGNNTSSQSAGANIKNNDDQWKPKEDNFELFPKPDPNYVPPKELPKPVDDWINDL